MAPWRHRNATAALTGLVVLAGSISLSSCGGGDDDSTSDAPSTTSDTTGDTSTAPSTNAPPAETEPADTELIEAELIEVTLPSGATASYPSTWTSYGDGFAGNLELAIPQVVNTSLRDAAASEYMYGPMLPDQGRRVGYRTRSRPG